MRYCWREPDNNQIVLFVYLLNLHTTFRYHLQFLQSIGLLWVPDSSNQI